MKTKFLYLAALALLVSFTACENETPFDTQTEDDAPQILKPYNESGTGSFTYSLANPDTPLFDSVTVTPSRYTTVNWYLDGQKIFTGTKINMCFSAGKYALMIEAVTTKGKRTERTGSVTVKPYPTDPYAALPAGGRHLVPGMEMTVDGDNLDQVATIKLTNDLYGTDVVCSVEPTSKTAAQLKFTLPETQNGNYYMFFADAEGKMYGSNLVGVHNGAVALDGFGEFVPGDTWTITGVNLQNVASVTVDDQTITELTVTATSVTLTAPAAEIGEHTLSMKNNDGSYVLFITADGTFAQVKTVVSEEKNLWVGPQYILWDADRVKVAKEDMAQVPENATILIYFEKLPSGHEGYYEGAEYKEYQALRITTPWWDGWDLVGQMDMGSAPSPFTFTYNADCKNKVETCGAMSLVGWGLQINKITYK